MVLNQSRPILQKLSEHGVAFIVVGGYAAVLAGAPLMTLDLDVVHSTEPGNVSRLLEALRDLEARYRHHPGFQPDSPHLSSKGHRLLMTRFGPLDILRAIGKGRAYADLHSHTTRMKISDDLDVAVLNLDTQIAIKEELGGEKDLAALPILRRTLEEIHKRKGIL